MKRLILLFLFLSSPVAAQGSLITGNGFLVACSREDDVSKAACSTYVQGMNHMLLAVTLNGQIRRVECSPDQTTPNQTLDMLLAYLRANPAIRHMGTPQIYMAVLSQAFPCPAEGPMPPLEKRF